MARLAEIGMRIVSASAAVDEIDLTVGELDHVRATTGAHHVTSWTPKQKIGSAASGQVVVARSTDWGSEGTATPPMLSRVCDP